MFSRRAEVGMEHPQTSDRRRQQQQPLDQFENGDEREPKMMLPKSGRRRFVRASHLSILIHTEVSSIINPFAKEFGTESVGDARCLFTTPQVGREVDQLLLSEGAVQAVGHQ